MQLRMPALFTRNNPLAEEIAQMQKEAETAKFFKQFGQDTKYTPDILTLERRARWSIFVHDDMLPGHRYHDMITETNLWGRRANSGGYTLLNFHVWYKDLGKESFPVALREPITGYQRNPTEPAPVWGQIYSIRGYQFKKLDFLRMNGVEFERIRVPIIVPIDHKVIYDKARPIPSLTPPSFETVECFMYVGRWDFWNNQLGGFLPSRPIPLVEHRLPMIGKHYNYQRYFKELNAKEPPF